LAQHRVLVFDKPPSPKQCDTQLRGEDK